jgi:hypothetical protein
VGGRWATYDVDVDDEGGHVVKRSTIRILCAVCVLLYGIFLALAVAGGSGDPSSLQVVFALTGLAAGVAAWVLALYRAGKSRQFGWLAVVGFSALAGGVGGFVAACVYAIAGPADVSSESEAPVG